LRQESRPARGHRDPELGRARARRGQARVNDTRLWHPWLRINRVLRVMLYTRWSAEAWAQVRVEFRKALALRSCRALDRSADPSRPVLVAGAALYLATSWSLILS
jgi:hypothetical protein